MSYSCPLCHAPLSRSDNHYSCPQRHQFDLAKEGYVNLLPVQFKRSRDPGDSAEMMQARRAFLDAGHYQPLRDAIAERLRHYAPTDLLDIGCGEGYYTHAFAAIASRSWGLDVSKPAIRAAAKRYPQVNFCVASSQRLPFSDASFDAVVRAHLRALQRRRAGAGGASRWLGDHRHAGSPSPTGAERADLR